MVRWLLYTLFMILLLSSCGVPDTPSNSANPPAASVPSLGSVSLPLPTATPAAARQSPAPPQPTSPAATPAPTLPPAPAAPIAATVAPVPTDEPMLIPPPATLTVAGITQTAGIGSYCWSDPQSGRGVCADAAGYITPLEPLEVRPGATARLRLPLDAAPSLLQLDVLSVTEKDAMPVAGNTWRVWTVPPKTSATTLPRVREQDLALPRAPGLYVLDIGAWVGPGDVSYGFLVRVE